MTLPTPDQIRSRQTAYLATEAWWKTRVEGIRELAQRLADGATGQSLYDLQCVANALDALLAERPSR